MEIHSTTRVEALARLAEEIGRLARHPDRVNHDMSRGKNGYRGQKGQFYGDGGAFWRRQKKLYFERDAWRVNKDKSSFDPDSK